MICYYMIRYDMIGSHQIEILLTELYLDAYCLMSSLTDLMLDDVAC